MDIANLAVRLNLDESDYTSGLNKVEKQTKSWGSGMKGILRDALSFAAGGLIERGILSIGDAIGGVFGGIKDGLLGAAQTGLDFNDSMEQTRAQIMAFTKDGAKTADILEMIRKRAAATPFEFDEMAKAAAGLIPSAKQSGAALEDLIGQAEILAASNPAQGLEGAAFALREAVSGDFVSLIERFNLPRSFINKLKDEGLPALEIVSRAMKELGLDSSLVGNLAETAQGRWSTFTDTLTNFAGKLTEPIFTLWSGGLAEVNKFLTANEPLLSGFADMMGGRVQEVTNGLTYILRNSLIPGLQGLFNQVGSGGLPVLDSFFHFINFQIVPGLLRFSDWIFQTGIPALTTFFSSIGTAYQSGGIMGVISLLATDLQTAWTETIQPKLGEWSSKFWNWISGGEGVAGVQNNTSALDGLINWISGFFAESWPTIKENLTEWSNKFWDWVLGPGGALERTDEALGKITAQVQAWAESPETQGTLQGIGVGLGGAIMDGLELLINNQERWTKFGVSVFVMLGKTIVSLTGILATAGTEIGTGIVLGLVNYFTGSYPSQEMAKGIRSGMEGAITALNPLSMFSGVGRDAGKGIEQGLDETTPAIENAAVSAARAALNAATSWLQTGSPSKRWADEVGAPSGEGYAMGFLSTLPTIQSAIQSALAMPDIAAPDVSSANSGGGATTYDQRSFAVNYSNTQPSAGTLDLGTMMAMG